MKSKALLSLFFFSCLLPAQALLPWHRASADSMEDSFSADRPGSVTSTDVLSMGTSQIETGFGYAQNRAGDHIDRAITVGSPLVRVGVARGIELRTSSEGLDLVSSREKVGGSWESARGVGDTTLGAKIALQSPFGWMPAISLVPAVVMPSGAKAFTHAAWDPSLSIAWSLNLPARLSAGGTLSVRSQTQDGLRYLGKSTSFALSRGIGRKWSTYAGAFVDSSKLYEAGHSWSFDGGMTRAFARHIQVDVESGTTMVRQGSSWFVSGGVAFRVPTNTHRSFRS